MKKIIAIASIVGIATVVGCSAKEAEAATVDLMFGKDRTADVVTTHVSVGKEFGKYTMLGQLSHVADQYTTYGVGTEYNVVSLMGMNAGVSASVALVDPKTSSTSSTGYTGSYGAYLTYPLSKTVAVKTMYTRTENLNNAAKYSGHNITLGLATSF